VPADASPPDQSRDWLTRLQRLTRWRQPPEGVRAVLLVVAAVGVTVGVVWSIRTLDIGWTDLRPLPLLLAALLASPATMAANAAELRVMAGVVARERPMPWGTALRATVVATAANLLPIPGGALVRIAAVRAQHASTAAATAINLVGAGAWVAAGLLLAAAAAVRVAPVGAVLVAAATGLVGLVVVTLLVHRLARDGRTLAHTSALVGVEAVTALVHGLRLWLVLLALGLDVTVLQGLALGAAAPLAAAAGVFPSGLGLAEALTAVIAPLVALPAAAGFAATALGRIVGLVVTGIVAVAFGAEDLRRRASRLQAEAEAADPEADPEGADDPRAGTDPGPGADRGPSADPGPGADEPAPQRERRARRVRRR
jgi:hypothetical protein